MHKLTKAQNKILKYMCNNKGWVRPSELARNADTVEHCCSWASHNCLTLTRLGYLYHNIEGQYRIKEDK